MNYVFHKETCSASMQIKLKYNATKLKYIVTILITNFCNNDIRKQQNVAIMDKIESKCLIIHALKNNQKTNLAWRVIGDENMRM